MPEESECRMICGWVSQKFYLFRNAAIVHVLVWIHVAKPEQDQKVCHVSLAESESSAHCLHEDLRANTVPSLPGLLSR